MKPGGSANLEMAFFQNVEREGGKGRGRGRDWGAGEQQERSDRIEKPRAKVGSTIFAWKHPVASTVHSQRFQSENKNVSSPCAKRARVRACDS